MRTVYQDIVLDHVITFNHSFYHKQLISGDYLTFERGQQVQSTQSDGRTPADRLEGLLMGMADFHVQMNFLKLIYRVLFQVCTLH